MKGHIVIAPKKGCVELQECNVGDPVGKEVQVRIHASLISPGTERAWILGMDTTPAKYPYAPGYCTAGVVEKVGPEATKLVVGDKVACYLIEHRSIGNIDEKWAIKIPDEIPFEEAAFMPLAQIAMQGARKARVELGEKVAVIGLGIIGQLALQYVRLCGALPAVGVDRVESRLKLALECGADEVINSSVENWMDAYGERPQVIIESTGNPNVVPMALQYVNTMGRVILLASTRGDSTVNFYRDVHRKGISVIGAHASRSIPQYESKPGYWTWNDDIDCFVRLLQKGRLNINKLITNKVKWTDAEKTYKEILEWNTDMVGTIIDWS